MNISDIISIVGIAIALIGIPSYLLGRRGRQLPDILFVIDFDIILDPDDRLLDQDLQMTIGAHQIKSISRTRLAFWNQRDIVRGADIVESDPIRLEFAEGDKPLQVRTLCCSREAIKLAASINSANPTSVNITFDFLAAKDGAIFEIVHQGTQPPKLAGTHRIAKMHRRSSSDFEPEKLMAFARRPRYRRIPKGAPTLTGFISAMIICVVIVVWLAFFYHTPAGLLVSAGQYNLHTMRGQGNFANAVFNANNPYAAGSVVGFFLSVVCFFLLVLVALTIESFVTFRRRIPYSITEWKPLNI